MLKGLPEAAIDIMLSSVTQATLNQYNCGLRRYWNFCQFNNFSIFDYNTTNVINFLVREFNSRSSYGTLNSFRSAIALLLGPNLGNEPVMKRFFKRVYNLRPSAPRYEVT